MKANSKIGLKTLYFILFISVVYFAFLPILSVFFYGIRSGQAAVVWSNILPRIGDRFINSLLVSLAVTSCATLIALIASFTLWRINFRGRRLLRLLVLLPLIHPPFVGSVAFIMLFGKRGLITHDLLGLEVSPYGYWGILTMQTIGLATLAYLLISSAMKNTDTAYEEAARCMGASEGEIFISVTLPLMIPEITAAALLVFLTSLADFSTPIIIGGNFQTLASDLYIQITGLYDMKTASISGIFLFFPCFLAFFLQKYFAEKKVYYGFAPAGNMIEYRNISLAVKGLLIFFTCLFVFFVFCQMAFIIIGAFTERWGYNYAPTLRHLENIITNRTAPFINSIRLAVFVSTVSSVLGVLLAYLIKAKKLPGTKSLDIMATLPAAIPGILLGIGYLVTFKNPLFGLGKYIFPQMPQPVLLGTGAIIYIICIYRYLYVGLKAGYALMEHLNPDLECAAIILGAGDYRVFWDIVFPLLKPAFMAAFLKNFSSTMTTLGAIIFLLLPSNKVAVQQIFQIMTSSEIGDAAMMALMLSFVSLVLLGAFHLLFNHSLVADRIKKGLLRGRNMIADHKK